MELFDKEAREILAVLRAIDRKQYYEKSRQYNWERLVEQLKRTDDGMSLMGRAELISKLYNRITELDKDIEEARAYIMANQDKLTVLDEEDSEIV